MTLLTFPRFLLFQAGANPRVIRAVKNRDKAPGLHRGVGQFDCRRKTVCRAGCRSNDGLSRVRDSFISRRLLDTD